MEADESEMRVTPGKKIWCKSVETRKGPNSPAIRCRLCATEVNTGEPRSDTLAATPSGIRATDFELDMELQAQANKCVDDHCCVRHFGGVLPWESAHSDVRGATQLLSQEGEDLEVAQESLRNS